MASEFAPAASIDSAGPQTGGGGLISMFRRLDGTIERWLEAERDQLPLWLPVALGFGIAAWFWLPDRFGWIAFLLALAAIAAGAMCLPAGGRLRRTLLFLAFTAALGLALIWWRSERVAAPRLERPIVTRFEGRVEAIDRLPARGIIRLRLAPVDAPALPPRLRVNVAEKDAPAESAAGARVALRARLMPPTAPTVPGAYDFARVAWFQGIGATGRALGPVVVVRAAEQGGAAAWLSAMRGRLSAHIQSRLAGGAGGIASALATGDQGAIPEEDAEAMRRSGLAHLLSVSGLHVTAVVAGTMFLFLRLLALSPRLALNAPLLLIAAGAGAVAGVGYTLLTGSEVPTVRSCIAALLVLAGIALGREAMTLRLVAAGALIVLLFRPEALAGPSFQLSFAAVTAIVALHAHPYTGKLLARAEEGRVAGFGRSLLGLLATGLAVEIALAPIALFHFHRAGLYGAVANIVAIPLTTFVIMPLEALALLFDSVGLGWPFWWLAGKALALLLWVAHRVAAAPGAVTALPSMPGEAYGLMVAGGLWLALWRTKLRRIGLVPLIVGAAWAMATLPPDLLVTGDGRHLALRSPDGSMTLLRERAGDYVRDALGGAAGFEGEAGALDGAPNARCGADLCAVDVESEGRTWRLLATRSTYLVDIAEMNRACAAADIVVSDRRLPRSCRPRWLKADRPFLEASGGLAIRLDGPSVDSVAAYAGRHPWARLPESSIREHRGARRTFREKRSFGEVRQTIDETPTSGEASNGRFDGPPPGLARAGSLRQPGTRMKEPAGQ
jgi:competence protein ComEC